MQESLVKLKQLFIYPVKMITNDLISLLCTNEDGKMRIYMQA
jgi:hypothetical protein